MFDLLKIVVFLALNLLLSISSVEGQTVTVSASLGTYTGAVINGVESFWGVPFAQPPTGNRRLQFPQPITQNFGGLDVSSPDTSRCFGLLAADPGVQLGTEDCLKLDIIRSHTVPSRLLPVFVFIHGGDFNSGDKSDIDPTNLVSKSAATGYPFIFVAINYRLSFLGFPGGQQAKDHRALNLGLKDQRAALHWVKDNIQAFGGDPNTVTLGGQATGADSVTYQMMAYGGRDDGLFQSVFLDSGAATGLTPIPKIDYPAWQNHYDDIVVGTNCSTASDPFVCLQNLPVSQLFGAFAYVYGQARSIPHHVYAPVVEGSWFQDYPSILMKASKFVAVPTLVGHTMMELIDRIPPNQNFTDDSSIIGFVQGFVSYVPNSTVVELLDLFNDEYPNSGPPGSGKQWLRVVDVDNYLQSFCPVQTAALQISAKGAPVWKFRWAARHSTSQAPPYFQVSQGADLPYLFSDASSNALTVTDKTLGHSYQTQLIAFINHRDPNKAPSFLYGWPEFNASKPINLVYTDQSNNHAYWAYTSFSDSKCAYVESHNLDFLR